MAKILGLLFICILLFGGGLAGSLLLRKQAAPSEQAEGADGGGEAGAAGAGAAVTPVGARGSAEDLPVAMHSRPMSADEVFRFAASIRGRERELQQRKEAVEQQEARLKMMEEDLRGQRREVDGLLGQLQDTLDKSNAALREVQAERQKLQQERASANRDLDQAQQQRQETSAVEAANLKKLSSMVQGMNAADAAGVLQTYVKIGELPTAAGLLSNFEERDAAKILEELYRIDPQIMLQVTQAYRKLQPATTARKP